MVDAAFRGLPAGQGLEPVRTAQVVEVAPLAQLEQAREAAIVIAEAVSVANELRKVVQDKKWSQKYGSREHLTIEALQFVGRFFEVAVRVTSTEYVQFGPDHGFRAVAEAVHATTGKALSRAEAVCMTDEQQWSVRPKYEWVGTWPDKKRKLVGEEKVTHQERMGMAQTRACSRALSNLFRSVVAMGGYAGTPAEGMPNAPEDPRGDDGAPPPESAGYQQPPQPLPPPEKKRGAAAARARITEEQSRDMRCLASEIHGNKAPSVMGKLLETFGYRVTPEVLAKDYEAVMKALEATRP